MRRYPRRTGGWRPRHRQRGIAALLIVLVVGLALSVTVAATVYAVRGNQSAQLTTHAATAAQAAAWRGVEALRRYLLQVDEDVWPGWVGSDDKEVGGLAGLGVVAAAITDVEAVGTDTFRVTARITGEAGVGGASTTSTVEVVYDVVPGGSGTPGTPPVCHSMPKAPLVFNGDLTYTGGKLEVVNAVDYENIVVAGDLSISNGSMARVSGCVKGDVSLSGGGLTDNGHVYSEGNISINNMSTLKGTTLWGGNIDIGNSGSSTFVEVRAGAYDTVVYSGGAAIGTAKVGGKLIPATVTGGLPWTVGTVVPRDTGRVVVTLADESRFLLDLGTVAIDAATGVVSGASSAEALWAPEGTSLADVLQFRSVAIAGGSVGMYTHTIGLLWGHDVDIMGWNGTYTTLWANGDLDIVSGKIGSLVGGGDMTANQVQVTGSGRLAGTANKQVTNVQANQAGTSPGLPGLPYCDARVNAVEAEDFKGSANYVFESVDGQAQLKIQNVKRADGTSIDGVYSLQSLSTSESALLQELMTCGYGNDKGCLAARQGDGSWELGGVRKMPAGVFWFDSRVEIDGTEVDLVSTIVNQGGSVDLTSAGHKELLAPNFAGAMKTCGGSYYPVNLCASQSALATWEDGDGVEQVGLPIANTAIISEEGASASGWTIRGSVLLGKQISTSGSTVTIHGSVTAGSNTRSDSVISAGGLSLQVPSGEALKSIPVCSAGTPPSLPAGPAEASVLWSRYL